MTTGTPALREWQEKARKKVLELWDRDPNAKALIAACPGAGKTFFTATLILELLREGKIKLAVILAPTINIQLLWVDLFKDLGIKATADASNTNLKWRKEAGVSMTEGNDVLVLTYAQLANDRELIAELVRRIGDTLLVGDEIHHADDDEIFGKAVQTVADECKYTLALTATPFNSVGGSIALCDTETDIDEEGRPIRRTIPTHIYNYGEAIVKYVCRPVEFIKVYGRGQSTYRLLSNNETFNHITDLAKQRKSDRVSILPDPDDEFMEECARQAVRALVKLRDGGDRKAAMLVVAKNKMHGSQMANLMARTCESENQRFSIQEIYNDTPKAHDRIENLSADTTDIIVSVRMISEGVDIKRLRVGLFATDWMTRMFFVQFTGRFVRYEDRLDRNQFAWIIIPAHTTLLKYTREIELMIESAAIVEDGDGEGPDREKKSEFIDSETQADNVGIIYRGADSENLDLAEALFQRSPSARGQIPNALAIKIAEEMNLDGASPDKPRKQKIDWSNRNDMLVRAIVKRLQTNGEPDDEIYAQVQKRANQAVGIKRKDALTAEETLIKRHQYLHQWLKRIRSGQEDQDNA